jgi:hypothetical protein
MMAGYERERMSLDAMRRCVRDPAPGRACTTPAVTHPEGTAPDHACASRWMKVGPIKGMLVQRHSVLPDENDASGVTHRGPSGRRETHGGASRSDAIVRLGSEDGWGPDIADDDQGVHRWRLVPDRA